MPLTASAVSLDQGAAKIGSFSVIGIYTAVASGATFTADGTATYKHVDPFNNGVAVNVPNGQIWRNVSAVAASAAGCALLCQRIG